MSNQQAGGAGGGHGGYQSFEQLMAQRYPQTGRSSASSTINNPNNMNAQVQQQQQQMNAMPPNPQLQHFQQQQQQQQQGGGNRRSSGSSVPPSLLPPYQGGQVGYSGLQQQQQRKQSVTASGASGANALVMPSTNIGGTASRNNSIIAKNQSSASTGGGSSKPASATGLAFNTSQQKIFLSRCNWKDKLLWSTRVMFGGNSINGFNRATATVQRIKKQRARQVALTRRTQEANAAAKAGLAPPEQSKKSDPKDANSKKQPFDQVEEEKLKKDIMNPRTANKMKKELEQGIQYCTTLHTLLRGILIDIEPKLGPYLPNAIITPGEESSDQQHQQRQYPPQMISPYASSSMLATMIQQQKHQMALAAAASAAGANNRSNTNKSGNKKSKDSKLKDPKSSKKKKGANAAEAQQQKEKQQEQQKKQLPPQSMKTTASPGDPSGSTLRKLRKKKLPANTEPPVDIPEFDPSGRRVCSKKEHHIRIFKALRFRALRHGDFVAARLSSRDLWILAMVQKDYPTFDMFPVAFVKLTDQKRDALFKDRVIVQDVEDKDKKPASVARNLVLPLPRTYSEAADWAQR